VLEFAWKSDVTDPAKRKPASEWLKDIIKHGPRQGQLPAYLLEEKPPQPQPGTETPAPNQPAPQGSPPGAQPVTTPADVPSNGGESAPSGSAPNAP
jgi:hypothetical protein